MSTATVTLAQAQANLREAERAVAKENRRRDEEAYRAAQAEARGFRDAYESLKLKFHEAERAVFQSRVELITANHKLDQHIAVKPGPLDFPTPSEEAAWERKKTKLAAERDRIAKELEPKDRVCAEARMAAIEAHKRVEHSRWVVKNLSEKLTDPSFPRGPRGGVSAVKAGGISGVTGC